MARKYKEENFTACIYKVWDGGRHRLIILLDAKDHDAKQQIEAKLRRLGCTVSDRTPSNVVCNFNLINSRITEKELCVKNCNACKLKEECIDYGTY